MFLSECWNLLNNNGKLILTTPSATSIVQITQALKPFYKDNDKNPHIQYFDKHCLKRLCNKIGYKNITVKFKPAHYRRNIPFRLLQQMFYPLRSHLLLVARK
jgi:hypothetical protein